MFTVSDSEYATFNITVCVCLCVWVVNGESDALTQSLSRLFDALSGFQWNENIEVRACVLVFRRMTEQSKRSVRAQWQLMCVCVCVSADSTTHITRDYNCPRLCGLLGQRFPEARGGFSFILGEVYTQEHIHMPAHHL